LKISLKFDYEIENNTEKFKLDVFDDLLLNLTSASLDSLLKLSEELSNLKISTSAKSLATSLPNKTPICIVNNETGSKIM